MKQALYRQILHQIVRQHGHALEPNDAELLCDRLLYSYKRESNKAYAYALDVIVAQLDSILARGGKRSRNNSITDEALFRCYAVLGPLLQACGKFRLVGRVCFVRVSATATAAKSANATPGPRTRNYVRTLKTSENRSSSSEHRPRRRTKASRLITALQI
jgi:hypothetical protein